MRYAFFLLTKTPRKQDNSHQTRSFVNIYLLLFSFEHIMHSALYILHSTFCILHSAFDKNDYQSFLSLHFLHDERLESIALADVYSLPQDRGRGTALGGG